ncbi:hypothetical protein [Scytonema sp. NUACC26]|uniref:hypothetical protein n=1 Tax=Scytonema sp. NUACC26 TaxID=3140176 RepID=UPI0034DC9B50
MTRKPHDQFAKQYLEELLFPFSRVEISREITDEVRQADILFSPSPVAQENLKSLGLLGKMTASSCLLEPFRNQPSRTEVRNCILKLFSYFGELQRKAKRERTSLLEEDLPRLWILATSASDTLLESFGAKLELKNWLEGVYFLDESFRTAIVAINELPISNETLMCRVLGRGTVQQNAAREVAALPPDNPLRQNLIELLFSWRISVQQDRQEMTEEDLEIMMNFREVYERERTNILQQGLQEGQRQVVENLLKVRFGVLDEELSGIVEPMLQLPSNEYSILLLQLSSLSREDLLARFSR